MLLAEMKALPWVEGPLLVHRPPPDSNGSTQSRPRGSSKLRSLLPSLVHNILCVLFMYAGLRLSESLRLSEHVQLWVRGYHIPHQRQLDFKLPRAPSTRGVVQAPGADRSPRITASGTVTGAGALESGRTRERSLLSRDGLPSSSLPAPAGVLSATQARESSWPSAMQALLGSPDACRWDLALHWQYSESTFEPVKLKLLGCNRTNGFKRYAETRSRVGRHGILVRERPHPYPSQVLQSLSVLALLQELQQLGQDAPHPRQLIVVTTTLARTFQKLHMLGLINSLRSARYLLRWVVVEGGRASEETASLLRGSGLPYVHLSTGNLKDAERWQGRELLEYTLRLHGLRYIRDNMLTGLVTFADDSTVFSPLFFQEAQKVAVFGAAPVGLLLQWGYEKTMQGKGQQLPKSAVSAEDNPPGTSLGGSEDPAQAFGAARHPAQTPVCEHGKVTGWHTVVHSPEWVALGGGLTRYAAVPDEALERNSLVWTGFILDAQLLWGGGKSLGTVSGPDDAHGPSNSNVDGTKAGASTSGGAQAESPPWPSWVRTWEEWAPEAEAAIRDARPHALGSNGSMWRGLPSILDLMVLEEAQVEPLQQCSGEVLVWWQRLEARPDSKFPPRWRVSLLEIVVEAKRTPWAAANSSTYRSRSQPLRRKQEHRKSTKRQQH